MEVSAFREAARAALFSVLFTGVSLAVMAVVRASVPGWMPDPGRLLGDRSTYLEDHYRLVARTLLVGVMLSCLFAVLVYRAIPSSTRHSRTSPHDVLWAMFHGSTDSPAVPVVQLRMADGTCLMGVVAAQDQSGPRGDRLLALAPPLSRQRPGEEAVEKVRSPWVRIIVPMASIEEMHVAFGSESSVAGSSGSTGTGEATKGASAVRRRGGIRRR